MKYDEKLTLLLVDDDLDLLESLGLLLSSKYRVLTASSVVEAKAIARNQKIDFSVVDLNFESQEYDGVAFLDWSTRERPGTGLIVLSADPKTERVVQAMRRKDLVEFVPKTLRFREELEHAIQRGIVSRSARDPHESEQAFSRSPAVHSILSRVRQIAQSQSACSILITGETGSGKEYLAKYFAKVTHKELVAANMASIPITTAESELFGHRKGAFTGAQSDKIGLIARAHRGIFFLDEIGECSLDLQAKLLRVIQEKEVLPVGGIQPQRVDVRFLAATNRNLEQMVSRGRFRLDLLNRLNTIVLPMPALRDRPEDVVFYSEKFLKHLGQQTYVLRSCAISELLSHTWPGNVRELANLMERISILAGSYEITGETIRRFKDGGAVTASKSDQLRGRILKALEQTQGNRAQAAELLKIHPSTLFRSLNRFGISNAIEGRPGRPKWKHLPAGGSV